MVFVVLSPGALKAQQSQKMGPQLKVSSKRLGEAGK